MVFSNFIKINDDLLALHKIGRLHHAIIIDGKDGIGKSKFAQQFANQILQSAQQFHPNILLIANDKKKEITVHQIRQISDFVNKSPAINNDKFVIIDSACQMNNFASNSLLKILEEPRPNNYLFLISHNIAKILPTIYSRCHVVKAKSPDIDQFTAIVKNHNIDLNDDQIKFLNEICDGSISLLLNDGKNLIKIYQLLLNSFIQSKLSDDLLKMASDKEFNFTIFVLAIEFFINRLLKIISDVKIELFFNEEIALEIVSKKVSWQKVEKQIDEILNIANKTDRFSLDRKISVINIFNSLNYA